MRFLTLVTVNTAVGPPPPEFTQRMVQAEAEARRQGHVLDTGGLAPPLEGARLRLRAGAVTAVDGPYSEAKEVIGSYAVLECPSRDAAVDSAHWLIEQFRQHWPGWEGAVEVREIVGPGEPWGAQ